MNYNFYFTPYKKMVGLNYYVMLFLLTPFCYFLEKNSILFTTSLTGLPRVFYTLIHLFFFIYSGFMIWIIHYYQELQYKKLNFILSTIILVFDLFFIIIYPYHYQIIVLTIIFILAKSINYLSLKIKINEIKGLHSNGFIDYFRLTIINGILCLWFFYMAWIDHPLFLTGSIRLLFITFLLVWLSILSFQHKKQHPFIRYVTPTLIFFLIYQKYIPLNNIITLYNLLLFSIAYFKGLYYSRS
jgi:hypothetical protein